MNQKPGGPNSENTMDRSIPMCFTCLSEHDNQLLASQPQKIVEKCCFFKNNFIIIAIVTQYLLLLLLDTLVHRPDNVVPDLQLLWIHNSIIFGARTNEAIQLIPYNTAGGWCEKQYKDLIITASVCIDCCALFTALHSTNTPHMYLFTIYALCASATSKSSLSGSL